jgi:hypothetical protein
MFHRPETTEKLKEHVENAEPLKENLSPTLVDDHLVDESTDGSLVKPKEPSVQLKRRRKVKADSTVITSKTIYVLPRTMSNPISDGRYFGIKTAAPSEDQGCHE